MQMLKKHSTNLKKQTLIYAWKVSIYINNMYTFPWYMWSPDRNAESIIQLIRFAEDFLEIIVIHEQIHCISQFSSKNAKYPVVLAHMSFSRRFYPKRFTICASTMSTNSEQQESRK